MMRFPSETALQQAGKDGKAVRLARDDRYDFRAALFYSPVVYRRDQLRPAPGSLPESWLEGFQGFVRNEFGRRAADLDAMAPDMSLGDCEVEEIDFIDTATRLVERYEERYVYGNRRLVELATSVRSLGPAARLHALLCTDEFGQKSNKDHVDDRELDAALGRRLDERAGLHGIMPCLPFRDQNLFRTKNSPATLTFAEVLFLARLHVWKIAVYRVLPGGGHMVCACDGTLYAEALGVSLEQARRYMADLRLVRDKLDLARTVSFVDLREIVESVARSRGMDFWALVDGCQAELAEALATGQIPLEALINLVAGMRWNVSSPTVTEDPAEMWSLLAADPKLLVAHATAGRSSSAQRIVEASLRYTSINLVLRYLDPLGYAFPDFMRFTMHAKAGQVAFPRLGSVFPWNGTAVFDSLDARRHKARVEPLHGTLAQDGKKKILIDSRWSPEPLGVLLTKT
jgi:hypothetical protein